MTAQPADSDSPGLLDNQQLFPALFSGGSLINRLNVGHKVLEVLIRNKAEAIAQLMYNAELYGGGGKHRTGGPVSNGRVKAR